MPQQPLRVPEVARVAGGFGADVTKLEGHARSFTRLIKAAPHRQHAQWPAVVVLDQEREKGSGLATCVNPRNTKQQSAEIGHPCGCQDAEVGLHRVRQRAEP